MPAAVAEHKVLSFVPYLKSPPTQTETGREVLKPSLTGDVVAEKDNSLKKTPSAETDTRDDDPYGPRQWSSNLVKLSGKNRALNEFSVERMGETVDQNLVMLHGYGAGLGFFYKNFEGLSRAKGWKVYALDMLGMGEFRPSVAVSPRLSLDRQKFQTTVQNPCKRSTSADFGGRRLVR